MSSSLTLTLTVTGTTGKAPLTPFEVTYALTGQDGALGPQAVKVPQAAAVNTVVAQVPTLTEQSALLIATDEQVTYQINSDGVNRVIRQGGFAVHPGNPVVTALKFGGNGSKDAAVTIFQLGTP